MGSGWPTLTRAIFPSTTQARTGSPASDPSRAFRPTDTGSTTWPATCGSGSATGIAPTTTTSWPRLVESRAIRRGRSPHLTRTNRTSQSAPSVAARSSAPINTAPATPSAHAARARYRPGPTISGSAVCSRRRRKPTSRDQRGLIQGAQFSAAMNNHASLPVGVLGASGYVGQELLRLLHGHPGDARGEHRRLTRAAGCGARSHRGAQSRSRRPRPSAAGERDHAGEHRLHEGVPRGVRSVARGRHDTRAAAGANQGKVPRPGARHRPADRFGGGAGAPVRPLYDGWMFAAMFAGPLLPRVANTASVTHVSADKTTAPHGGC